MSYYYCVVMFRRIFNVYLTHIIRFATMNRATPDIRYYVSSNIQRIFDSHNSLCDHEPGYARHSLLCFVEYSHYICVNDIKICL